MPHGCAPSAWSPSQHASGPACPSASPSRRARSKPLASQMSVSSGPDSAAAAGGLGSRAGACAPSMRQRTGLSSAQPSIVGPRLAAQGCSASTWLTAAWETAAAAAASTGGGGGDGGGSWTASTSTSAARWKTPARSEAATAPDAAGAPATAAGPGSPAPEGPSGDAGAGAGGSAAAPCAERGCSPQAALPWGAAAGTAAPAVGLCRLFGGVHPPQQAVLPGTPAAAPAWSLNSAQGAPPPGCGV